MKIRYVCIVLVVSGALYLHGDRGDAAHPAFISYNVQGK
ncbi:TPA: small toxic inner membrane protein TimP [Citrobacter braakii]